MNIFIGLRFDSYYRDFPLVLIDVGARGGLKDNWKRAEGHLKVIGFEPDGEEFEKLTGSAKGPSTRYLNTTLYRNRDVIELNIARKRGVSSILNPDRKFLDSFPDSGRYDIVKKVRLEADTLDNQLKLNNIEDVDFIKIDTQGSELYIMEGARRTIENSVFGLEVEAGFVGTYEKQPLFSDVDNYIRKSGFYLFDLQHNYWKRKSGTSYGGSKGQIIFADAVYLRTPESFGDMLDKSYKEEIARKAKILKAISTCIIYGYLDYAVEIFERSKTLFSKEENRILMDGMRKEIRISNKIPNFFGRGKLSDVFYALYKVFHPEGKRWFTIGKALGNTE